MKTSVMFWKDEQEKSRNAIAEYKHIFALHVSSTSTFTRIVQTVLC